MLVAEKRQYVDTYYQYPVEKEQPISVPRAKAVPRTKTKVQRKILHLFMVLVGFALCSYTVARFAMIAQNQQEILDLEKALKEQQNVQEYLKLELAARGDLDRIEEFAKNNLEMDYPDKEQVLYVELPERQIQKTADDQLAVEDNESLWSKILSLLD